MSLIDESLLDAFFSTGFEEPVVVYLESGAVNTLCHYYDKYQNAKLLEKDVESSMPMIEVRSSFVLGVKQGDKVVFRETEYKIKDPQPDGDGFTQLTIYTAND